MMTDLSGERLIRELAASGFAIVRDQAHEILPTLRGLWAEVASTQSRGFMSSARDFELEPRVRTDAELKRALGPLVHQLLPAHRSLMAAFINKSPGAEPLMMHRDLSYTDESTWRSFTIWVPLVDVGSENAPLVIARGTHKSAPFPRAGGRFGGMADDEFGAAETEVVEAGAGDVVIWDSATWHGSLANLSRNERPVAALTVADQRAEHVYFHGRADKGIEVYDLGENYLAELDPFLGRPQGRQLLRTIGGPA